MSGANLAHSAVASLTYEQVCQGIFLVSYNANLCIPDHRCFSLIISQHDIGIGFTVSRKNQRVFSFIMSN